MSLASGPPSLWVKRLERVTLHLHASGAEDSWILTPILPIHHFMLYLKRGTSAPFHFTYEVKRLEMYRYKFSTGTGYSSLSR
jgi:hypothetical protein